MDNKDDLVELRNFDRDTYRLMYQQMQRGLIEKIVIDGRIYCRKEDINKNFRRLRGRKAKK